eukprot:397246-Pelagomonas_calceolata.AAC.2
MVSVAAWMSHKPLSSNADQNSACPHIGPHLQQALIARLQLQPGAGELNTGLLRAISLVNGFLFSGNEDVQSFQALKENVRTAMLVKVGYVSECLSHASVTQPMKLNEGCVYQTGEACSQPVEHAGNLPNLGFRSFLNGTFRTWQPRVVADRFPAGSLKDRVEQCHMHAPCNLRLPAKQVECLCACVRSWPSLLANPVWHHVQAAALRYSHRLSHTSCRTQHVTHSVTCHAVPQQSTKALSPSATSDGQPRSQSALGGSRAFDGPNGSTPLFKLNRSASLRQVLVLMPIYNTPSAHAQAHTHTHTHLCRAQTTVPGIQRSMHLQQLQQQQQQQQQWQRPNSSPPRHHTQQLLHPRQAGMPQLQGRPAKQRQQKRRGQRAAGASTEAWGMQTAPVRREERPMTR